MFDLSNLQEIAKDFEAKTKPIFRPSNDGQYANIKALLGLTDEDIYRIFAVADSYIQGNEKDIFHQLRTMFTLGFVIALYSIDTPSEEVELH